jgi:hypothetical protein
MRCMHMRLCMQGVESVWLCPWLPESHNRTTSSSVLPSLQPNSTVLPSSPHGLSSSLLDNAHGAALGSTGSSPRHLHTMTSHRMSSMHMEMPWWIYSSAGMHLLFPSTLASGGGSQLELQVLQVLPDPELQFDPEVFPVGISLADAAIIGMTQRLKRGTTTASFRGQRRKVRDFLNFNIHELFPSGQEEITVV